MSRVLRGTWEVKPPHTRQGHHSPRGISGLRERDVVLVHLGMRSKTDILLGWLVYITLARLIGRAQQKARAGTYTPQTGESRPPLAPFAGGETVRESGIFGADLTGEMITRPMIRTAHEAQKFTGHRLSPKVVVEMTLWDINEDKKGRVAHPLKRRYAREQRNDQSLLPGGFLTSREFQCRKKTRPVRDCCRLILISIKNT